MSTGDQWSTCVRWKRFLKRHCWSASVTRNWWCPTCTFSSIPYCCICSWDQGRFLLDLFYYSRKSDNTECIIESWILCWRCLQWWQFKSKFRWYILCCLLHMMAVLYQHVMWVDVWFCNLEVGVWWFWWSSISSFFFFFLNIRGLQPMCEYLNLLILVKVNRSLGGAFSNQILRNWHGIKVPQEFWS